MLLLSLLRSYPPSLFSWEILENILEKFYLATTTYDNGRSASPIDGWGFCCFPRSTEGMPAAKMIFLRALMIWVHRHVKGKPSWIKDPLFRRDISSRFFSDRPSDVESVAFQLRCKPLHSFLNSRHVKGKARFHHQWKRRDRHRKQVRCRN